MSNATSCGLTSRRVIVVLVRGSVADVAAYAVTVLNTVLFDLFTASATRIAKPGGMPQRCGPQQTTVDPPALIPVPAVNESLKAWGAECAVERCLLVAGHVGAHIRITIEERLRLLAGHVGSDEH